MSKIKPTNIIFYFYSLLSKNQSIKQKIGFHDYVSYTDKSRCMSSCMFILILGILLVFLSSCSTSTQNSHTTSTPSGTADENNTTAPSEPSSTSTPSVKPTQNIEDIPPTRPFPDFPPNYLQWKPQWLLNDINGGVFAVGGDSIAANYQVWHEFIGKVNKNQDAALTIQTFYIDPLKEENVSGRYPTRYEKVDRYHLSVAGNQAVWEYASDDKNNITGRLSFTYDAETGLHEVFIEEKKVFEFIYFPYDPKQSALYFGYVPLEELPSAYTSEDAVEDGCLVIEQGVIQNINVLRNFRDKFEQYSDVGIFIRIFFEDDEGIKIMDIGAYNERVCIFVDYSRHSNREDMEDIYITTYYDNCVISIEGVNALRLSFDDRESLSIFEDVTVKKESMNNSLNGGLRDCD